MSNYQLLIKKMTLEEKASLLSGKDVWHTREIEHLGISCMTMADGPHGLRYQVSEGDHLGLVEGVDATCFPTAATMANSWDPDLCEKVGQALGREAAFHGVNIILGPGLNIKRNPLCGRNFEYYSEDPYLSGKLAASYVRGMQKEGVSGCLKHFAANNQEYLRMTNDSVVDDRTLHEIYLTGFEIAVKESKPGAVMSAYNKVNGVYANENQYLLREVLVEEWGFDGMVISDWGGSNDPVEGVRAGSHLEMPTPGIDSIDQLVQAVKEGSLKETVIDERVDEFLKVLYSTQIKEKRTMNYNEHHQLAKKAAQNSIVLLKNDDVLPLEEKAKVAIIGDFAETPRYQGAGSSMVKPYTLDNTLNLVNQTGLSVIGYAKGYDRVGKMNASLISEAVTLAEKADIVLLYIGLNEVDEVEGHDRTHMKLAENQLQLIEAVTNNAKKTVAVISGGSAIEMPWVNKFDAIIHGYLSGQAGAGAMLDVITGKINPSGKLSESYPIRYEDCSSARYYPGRERTSEYREGLYVGYRYYDKANLEMRYPFGYGLSYTNFKYSDLVVDSDKIRCKITNTGDMVGSEIVQMYVGRNQEKIDRPEKELKGFCKVYLEPQETKEISIAFDDYTFRYYNSSKKAFAIQKGIYAVHIASSSRDIHLYGTIEVDGDEITNDESTVMRKYFDGNVADISKEEFEVLYGKSVPESNWNRKEALDINDSMLQMIYAKSGLARMAIKVLIGLRNRSYKKGKPDLNLFFLSSMPFRAIAKMSDGNVTMEMTRHILTIVNGRFFKGLGGLIRSFIANRKRGTADV